VNALALAALVAVATPSPMPAPTDWLARSNAIVYVSASGDSVAVSPAAGEFSGKFAEPGMATTAPNIVADRASGLIRVCFQPEHAGGDANVCRYRIDLRTADTGIPPGTPDSSLTDAAIGMTYAQLLAYLHSQPRMEKTIVRGKAGDPVMVSSHVAKGGDNCNSGQCEVMNTVYTDSLYFLADNLVVAVAWMQSNDALGAF
jgi:hypothetical protein